MPGKRSYVACIGTLTAAQLHRKQKDERFRSWGPSARTVSRELDPDIVNDAPVVSYNGKRRNVSKRDRISSGSLLRESGGQAWADISDKEDNGVAPSSWKASEHVDPWLGKHLPPMCNKTGIALLQGDAWSNFLPTLSVGPVLPPLPPLVLNLRASATEFTPLGSSLEEQLTSALALVEKQNETIGVLMGNLNKITLGQPLVPTMRGDDSLCALWLRLDTLENTMANGCVARLQAVEDTIENMYQTFGDSVQKSLESRLTKVAQEVTDDSVQRLQGLSEEVGKIVTSTVRQHDTLLQKQFRALNARLDDWRPTSSGDAAEADDEGHDAEQSSQMLRVSPQDTDFASKPDVLLPPGVAVSPPAPEKIQIDIEEGMCVNVVGLSKTIDLNGCIGTVAGFDCECQRFLIKVPQRKDIVKIKRDNLQYPASCGACGCEVSSSQCYACNGLPSDAVSHLRVGCCSDSEMNGSPETRSCEQENSVILTSIMPPTCGSTHSHSLIRHVPGSDK